MGPLPQGKEVGDSFLLDWYSKMRTAGQSRDEDRPCPGRRDHVFLILEVRRPSQLHMHRKYPWRSKGKWCQPTHRPLHLNPSWLRDKHVAVGGSWVIQNTDSETGKSKSLVKETWKKCALKVIQTPMRARLSLWVCRCVYEQVLYSFPPNTLFVALLTVLREFFSAKLKGQGLAADFWSRG